MIKLKILFLSIVALLCIYTQRSAAQGLNHTFLLGYTIGLDSNVISHRGKMDFDSVSVLTSPQNFKMGFDAAQANISDENGNLIISTNGCWIADATGDTMQNGSGLNPGSFANSYCNSSGGIPYEYTSIVLTLRKMEDLDLLLKKIFQLFKTH